MWRKLGKVLGSRTSVKIHDNDGRLPDILFIRADNTDIIHNDAIYGIPDLVIEIISENDRPVNLVPLEADYRDIGVPEILFIDPRRKRVRYLLKTEAGYDESFLTTGTLAFASVPGFHIEVEWLFLEDKPDELTLINQLISEAEKSGE
jgi:Uma2 family endonuclease